MESTIVHFMKVKFSYICVNILCVQQREKDVRAEKGMVFLRKSNQGFIDRNLENSNAFSSICLFY